MFKKVVKWNEIFLLSPRLIFRSPEEEKLSLGMQKQLWTYFQFVSLRYLSLLFVSMKVCESCHKTKPRDQFSTKQFKKLHGQCVKCINTKICSNPPVDLPLPPQIVPQNMEQTLPQQIFTVDVNISILHQLQQENHLLKLELMKCRQESEQKSIQISKYADMVPQLHNEIERLRRENDDLRSEISQLKSQVKILEQQKEADQILLQRYGHQIQILISAKERERQLAIRRLMDYIKADENLKNQLSEGAKNLIADKSTKNKVNSAAHSLSQDLIKEAIQSENKLQFKSSFIEMYRLVFGEYEEDEAELW
jgi:cell division protein FtsB